MIQLARVMDALGLNHTNCTVISGVGCTVRLAGYMNVDKYIPYMAAPWPWRSGEAGDPTPKGDRCIWRR